MPDADWVEKRKSFNNAILSDYEEAMDRFFTKIDADRKRRGMSDFDVFHALEFGYGDEVAAEWQDWVSS